MRNSSSLRLHLLLLFVPFILTGCGGGAKKYQSEVKSFRTKLSKVAAEVRTSAASAKEARYKRVFAERTSDLTSAQLKKLAAQGNDDAFYSAVHFYRLPNSSDKGLALSEPLAQRLEAALKALDEFSKLMAKFAGLEENNTVTVSDIQELSELFKATSGFLTSDAVGHPGFLKNPLLKSDLDKLGGWFTQGAGLLEQLAAMVTSKRRGAAIRLAVREGFPYVDQMVPPLKKIHKRLQQSEQNELTNHRLHLAGILRDATKPGARQLSFADQYLIKQELLRLSLRLERYEKEIKVDNEVKFLADHNREILFNGLSTSIQALRKKTGVKAKKLPPEGIGE